tara:strand:+ start:11115 stop:11714 length:600 start_codon:yes stop_codon:yes gene_type:complete
MAYCAIEEDLRANCGDEYPTAGLSVQAYVVPVDAIDESGVTLSATTHAFTAFAVDTINWSVIELKIDSGALTAENAKDGGGNVFNYTIEGFISNNDPLKSFKLEALNGQRVCLVVPLNTRNATTKNRLAKVIGYDSKKGKGAGAHLMFNDTVEAESGGQNGYALEITASQAESARFADFQITFEDGSTGTTVDLGAFTV